MSKSTRKNSPRIYRLPTVEERTGFCRSWIYFLMSEKKFPKAIRIGKRAVGWDGDQVDQWISDRLEGRV